MAKLLSSCHSNTENEQKKALEGVFGLLYPVKKYFDPNKKGKTVDLRNMNGDGRQIELIIAYLGNPKLINSYIDLGEPSFMKESMDYIFNNLMLPFVEIELMFIRLLLSRLH